MIRLGLLKPQSWLDYSGPSARDRMELRRNFDRDPMGRRQFIAAPAHMADFAQNDSIDDCGCRTVMEGFFDPAVGLCATVTHVTN